VLGNIGLHDVLLEPALDELRRQAVFALERAPAGAE
jgi:hypothetical protein